MAPDPQHSSTDSILSFRHPGSGKFKLRYLSDVFCERPSTIVDVISELNLLLSSNKHSSDAQLLNASTSEETEFDDVVQCHRRRFEKIGDALQDRCR